FATEGWLYALVSAAAGAIAGIGMGWLITERSEGILSSGREIDRLRLDFAFDPSSVALGFALGFLISLVTIVVTSTRIARLNVIRAIRDLPEPTGRHPRRRWGALAVVAVGAGTAWGVAGLVGPDPYGAMVGPVLAASGAAALAWRRWPSSWVVGVTGPAVLAWTVAVVPLLGALDVDYDVPIFLVQGLILVAAAVATVMVHQASIGRLVARASGGSQAVRLGLAYPLARPFRTAMTLAMIAIVVLTLAYISVLSHLFHGQTDEMAAEQSPTFEVVVQSNPANPVPMTELAAVPGVDAVAPLVHGAAEFQRLGHDPVTWPVTGFDAELLAGPPTLIDLGGHPDAATAWRAVLDDPSLTIVDEIFLVTTIGPPGDLVEVGEVVTMTDPVSGRSHDLTVTALASSDYVTNGAYVTRDAVAMVFDRAVASRAMVSAADPDAVAERIRTSFVPHGVVADTVTDQVEALMALSTGFFTLMQQFVGIGLIVGMAGIAVIMVRAVRERRREIGVLRSLGLPAPSVARAFVVEAGFVAVEGVTIGLLTAIVASYGVVRSGASWAEQLEWSLPVGELAVIVAVALGSALLAAAGPARAAARTRPAVALRLAE
ncbi:MAG TPA: FtsX-like permease family protein, partial [Acidimicrobiales bacterium]|nr:FtsX-like permease family protein [Acidimicrobiales bacterium]